MGARLTSERGWAMVTAVMVMMLMGMLALASFAYVATQQRQSGVERIRESSFNLAEGALNNQAFVLSRRWPATAGAAQAQCTSTRSGGGWSATSNASRCPSPALLAEAYASPDYGVGSRWTTTMWDNTNPNLAWDADGDGRMWVRSQAFAQSNAHRRTVLTQVRVERAKESFPANVVTAGYFQTKGGPSVTVNTNMDAPLAVRCVEPVAQKGKKNDCIELKRDEQIQPPEATRDGYPNVPALAPDALDRLRERAVAEGGHYANCPPQNPARTLVIAENCNAGGSVAPCPLGSAAGCTSAASPGIFIVVNGSVDLPRNFYGLVYIVNQQGSNQVLVSSNGPHYYQGVVAVDGGGGFEFGTANQQTQFVYDPKVFDLLYSYGNGGVVRNTWREITG